MRQKFDSYDDYRQAIDGVINRLIGELAREQEAREQEKLRSELLKIIAWADKNNIPQDRLPRDTEELCNLDTLYLNSLGLTHLPDSIGKLSQLTRLNVLGNQLTHLPDSIGKLTNLKKLRITDNPIIELPEYLYQLSPDVFYEKDEVIKEMQDRVKSIQEKERLERERLEKERLERERLEQERLRKEQEDAKIINRIKRFIKRFFSNLWSV